MTRPDHIPNDLWDTFPPVAQLIIADQHHRILTLEARVAQLTARVAELEAQLRQTSANSSKPPSSDPPHVKPAPPKSAVAVAIRYLTNHWAAFVRYTEDGRLSLDNNRSERTLRIIAVGRTNWKFVGSAAAGERAAVHFSLVGTCRHLGLDAAAYLREVLPALHTLGVKPPADQLAPLLPDVWAKRQQPHLIAA